MHFSRRKGRKRGIYWPSISFSFAGQICTPSILGPNIKKKLAPFSRSPTQKGNSGAIFVWSAEEKKFSFELDARNCFSAYIPALCKMRKKSEEGIYSFSFEYLLPHNVKKITRNTKSKRCVFPLICCQPERIKSINCHSKEKQRVVRTFVVRRLGVPLQSNVGFAPNPPPCSSSSASVTRRKVFPRLEK